MLVVQKFGGTSVGTPRRIRRVADRIAERHRRGDRVVVVVSAMGHTTDRLLDLAHRVTENPSRREIDMLLTAGERISMSLLSMALNTRGVPAISFTGSQSGIITDDRHTRARILEIRPIRIGPELEAGRVVIVAGFQGVSRDKEITTLGRGGSDTTAVGLAAGLGADLCEIYTDVPGVMSADPRLVSGARVLPRIGWDAMLELAVQGAGVMHARAVECARRHRVPFEVRSTFRKGAGTLVNGNMIEKDADVVAVTGKPEVLRVTVAGLGDADRAALLEALGTWAEDGTRVAGLETAAQRGSLGFHVPAGRDDAGREGALADIARRHGGTAVLDRTLAAVTLVGSGILDVPAVAARAHRTLAQAGIPVAASTGGTLSLTFLVPRAAYAEAQSALHAAFLGTAATSATDATGASAS